MGKHIVTRTFILRLLFFAVLCISVSRAAEMNIPYLKCDITLSKNTITPGEPLNLCFAFTNTSDGEVHVSLEDDYDIFDPEKDNRAKTESLRIAVFDSAGLQVPRREVLCRPRSQVDILSAFLKPGETITQEYPLQLRISTCLAAGQYHVVLESFDLWHACASPKDLRSTKSGILTWDNKRGIFSGPSLILAVDSSDSKSLTAVYDNLIDNAKNAINRTGGWRGEDYSDIETPIRTLLWAEGPIAVPYQIELMYDKERGFRYWPPAIANTWDNIVRHATPEQIELVLEMARHPECVKEPDTDYSSHYTPGLAWAIHQWNATGPESIKEKTRDLVGRFPDEDPCPQSMERGLWPYGKP